MSPTGVKSDCPACSNSLHHLHYPPPSHTQGDIRLWHTGGEKIMKIILHEDLCDTNFTYAFFYLMIHAFISYLNYIRNFKKICTVEWYIYFSQHFTQVLSLYFIKNFSIITTQNIFWKLTVSIFGSIKTFIYLTKETCGFWNFVCCDNGYPNKCMWQKPENGLAAIPNHM